MNQTLQNHLENFNYKKAKEHLQNFEGDSRGLQEQIIPLSLDFGIIPIILLIELATEESTIFWYDQVAYIIAFKYAHIGGAQEAALYYFIKAHEKQPQSIPILEAILDFDRSPAAILGRDRAIHFANLLLSLASNHSKANQIIKKYT